eukprot:CAMPEP_0179239828 /NCGR_PEP_ID=MMETSP0797-20121207/15662_1 /TAXON_ID=47934 /ORGANISM="Dinophysis acuminata, Strain DAEP01" /LENGTH=304 /DNA_ID=CAMNT_0020947163 /DNA_START=134 /DNA_END=1043 /DNA_ORIENTATION=-
MARIWRLEIDDPRMACIARGLVYPQCCICVIFTIYAVLVIVANILYEIAVGSVEDSTGEENQHRWSLAILGTLVLVVFCCLWPVVILVAVRRGLRYNNNDYMSNACYANACGVCCSVLATLAAVGTMIYYGWSIDWMGTLESKCPGYTTSTKFPIALWMTTTTDNAMVAAFNDCVDTIEASKGTLGLLGILAVAGAAMGLVAMLLYAFATYEANMAFKAAEQELRLRGPHAQDAEVAGRGGARGARGGGPGGHGGLGRTRPSRGRRRPGLHAGAGGPEAAGAPGAEAAAVQTRQPQCRRGTGAA